MSDTLHSVTPVGVFGLGWPPDDERTRRVLLPLVGRLPEDECPSIAMYLRAGTIIRPFMEWTTDEIGAFPRSHRKKIRYGVPILEQVGGRFDVAGGSGILTDGTYYWRRDTADYVEHYWVGLSEDFLCHGRSLRWTAPPPMTEEQGLAIYQYLTLNMRPLFPKPG